MEAVASHDEHAGPHARGLVRWITTTNHKDIGTLYLCFSLAMFFIAGFLAMLIRAELFEPGARLFSPALYNQFVTMHGLMMIFGVIMPAFVGFANWQIPLMIGAPDMAFPRMNNWSFWLLPFAALLMIAAFACNGASAVSLTPAMQNQFIEVQDFLQAHRRPNTLVSVVGYLVLATGEKDGAIRLSLVDSVDHVLSPRDALTYAKGGATVII
ncbi:MAG: cbb3-type cytochrome c oxidase subunit I, partial [Betaproteobacteria bacterium]|nr:cbb3-type cytochrome c oxidase subunit I [Betaproteobacteria bacterium]